MSSPSSSSLLCRSKAKEILDPYTHLWRFVGDITNIIAEYATRNNDFAFVMIVGRECKIILECLESIKHLATSYLICNVPRTNSIHENDDDTIQKVESFMNANKIPGQVIHFPWQNFGINRTYIMDQARIHPATFDARYICWLDAWVTF